MSGVYLRTAAEKYAPVAQGIEQRFPVPRVGGSNPSRCAFFVITLSQRGGFSLRQRWREA